MAYLPSKIEVAEKVQTFTPDLKGLIAWLETREPGTKYSYCDCSGLCLLDQFMTACGLGTDYYKIPSLVALDSAHIAVSVPHTFGAALSRARALVAHP